jgi:myo-inositol-1(or 4)-monophosphatase
VSAADPAALLDLAAAIAREAGAALAGYATRPLRTDVKSQPTDVFTEADLAAERLIRDRLAAARPDDGVLGEEGGDTPGSTGLRWVVDPLDGTVNFLYGIPVWCVSIAVERVDGGGTIAGAVFDPSRDELWTAHKGGEARCNGQVLRTPRVVEPAMALVATGFGYDPEVRRRQAALIAELLPMVRDIRRAGSAALDLCWTAAGRYDAYFERGVNHWDAAAGLLVCERAGLVAHRLAPAPPAAEGILVAPSALAEALLAPIA